MQFGTPSLLLGLVAAAVPYLVHLIGKRRAVPVRFAAMQLLLRSEKRGSARRRVAEALLGGAPPPPPRPPPPHLPPPLHRTGRRRAGGLPGVAERRHPDRRLGQPA